MSPSTKHQTHKQARTRSRGPDADVPLIVNTQETRPYCRSPKRPCPSCPSATAKMANYDLESSSRSRRCRLQRSKTLVLSVPACRVHRPYPVQSESYNRFAQCRHCQLLVRPVSPMLMLLLYTLHYYRAGGL